MNIDGSANISCLGTLNVSGISMINGNVTCKSTLTTTTTNSNVLVSYFLPTPYNNSITPVNQAATSVVNLCTATTAGFAITAPYLSVKCSDIANYFGTIVTLTSQGYYASGCNYTTSINLDSSYNTNGAVPGDGGVISFNVGSKTVCTFNRNGVGIGTTPRTNLDVYGAGAKLVVRGTSEADTATLYLGTPFDANSAFKCAFIAQGLSSYSRSKLHICLNNTNDNNPIYNAGISMIIGMIVVRHLIIMVM